MAQQRSNRNQAPLPVFLVAGSNQTLAGTYASGTVTMLAKASLTDAQTITLDDGINTAVIFELDVAGNGVTAGRVQVDVSGDTTDAEVAATMLAAINAASNLNLTATAADEVLTITNTVKGDHGNVTTWASSNTTINAAIVQPTGGEANLVGTGDAFAIADKQLGIIASGNDNHDASIRDNDFISAGDTPTTIPAIKLVQGTPYSTSLSSISAFGHTHKAVVKSAPITKANLKSVATYKYELPRYEIDYLTAVGDPVAGKRYALTVTLESPRTDITHGMNREVLQSSVTIPSGSANDSYLLEQLAYKFNRDYSKYVGFGHHNVIAFCVDTAGTGTVMGGLTSSTAAFNFQLDGEAGQKTFAPNQTFVHSLNTAIGNVAGISTAGIVNINPASSPTVNALMIVTFHNETLPVFDDVPSLRERAQVTLGPVDFDTAALAVTNTKACTGFDGSNTGRQVALEFNRRARQLAFSLENYVNHNEYPLQAPIYVDENQAGYNVTVLEIQDTDDTPFGSLNQNYKQVFICLPAAVSNASADADTGYTIATSQTNTVTALNTDLTPWIAATDAEYKGSATSTAVFV